MPGKVMLSDERVVDSSDSGSDSDSPPAPQPTKKSSKAATKAVKSLTNGSSRKSDMTMQVAHKSPKTPAKSNTATSATSDEDESSSSDKSSSSSSKKRAAKSAAVSEEPPKKKSKVSAQHSKVTRIEPRPFFPPSGYTTIPASASDYISEVSSLLDNLGDKQIWHITTSASVDITQLSALDIDAALKGAPILQQNGVHYCLEAAKDNSSDIILHTHGPNNQYRQADQPITRSFHLRETTRPVPKSTEPNGDVTMTDNTTLSSQNHSDENGAATIFYATQTGQAQAPREQPQGLRVRWTPYGAPSPRPSAVPVDKTQDTTMSNGISIPVDIEDDTRLQQVDHTKRSKKTKKQTATVETVPGTDDVMNVISSTPGREKIKASQPETPASWQPENKSTQETGGDKKKKRKKDKTVES